MCGIFGFLGLNTNCFDHGINGLKQLQNREYDSAGYCIIENNEFVIKKFASTIVLDSITVLDKTKNNCSI